MLDLNQHYYTEGLLCHGHILLFPLLKKLRALCPVPAIVPTDINIPLVVMFFWDFFSFY